MTKVQTVIDRANNDPTFRGRLRADPSSAFREAGLELPTGATVEVIDANRGDIHLLLGGRVNVPELDRIAERADHDASFKKLLLHDPRTAVESQIGAKLPPTCNVHVREANPNTIYLYLRDPLDADRALSDRDLEAVAGGLEPISVGIGIGIGVAATWIGAYFARPMGTLNAFNNPLDTDWW